MAKTLSKLFFLSILALSLPGHSFTRIGQCTNLNDSVINRFVFTLNSSPHGYTSLIIDGVMVSNQGQETSIMGRQEIQLNNDTVKHNSPSAVFINDGQFYLGVDRATGFGKYEFSYDHDTCWPGESEWCVIRIPGYTHREFQLSECTLNL